MIENKSLGSKIFDILNVVILIAVTLICTCMVRSLCIPEQQRSSQCRTGCSLAGWLQLALL